MQSIGKSIKSREINPNSPSSPFLPDKQTKSNHKNLLGSSKKTKKFDDMMETIIEIMVNYKGLEKKNHTRPDGVIEEIEVGVYDLEIKYTYSFEQSGEMKYTNEVFLKEKYSKNNKIFIGVSLDFKNNKGKLFYNSFDKFNSMSSERNLNLMTDGNLYVNRGFEIVSGDTSHHKSSIIFTDQNNEEIEYQKSPTKETESKFINC